MREANKSRQQSKKNSIDRKEESRLGRSIINVIASVAFVIAREALVMMIRERFE